MVYRRKIRIEYYEVVCRSLHEKANTPDTKFDFSFWIQKASDLSLEERTHEYFQEQARLDKLEYNSKTKYWLLNFIRLRETNIPTTAKKNAKSIPMELDDDEYIGEEVNALYDDQIGIFVLQRNKFSLGVSGIEEYLNLVWESDKEHIYLRPIAPIDLQEKATKAFQYRKFTIRFADVRNKSIKNPNRGPFNMIFDSLKKYNGVSAEVTVSMGYNHENDLDEETVKETIDDIVENEGLISKAEFSFKGVEDTHVEVVDVFSDKLHDFILIPLERRRSLGSEFVEGYMVEKYNKSRGYIVNSLRKRENE